MTYVEAMQWAAYRAKHGAVSTASRLELHLASLQSLIVNAMGGDANPKDFMPGMEDTTNTASSDGIDINQAIAAFKAAGEF